MQRRPARLLPYCLRIGVLASIVIWLVACGGSSTHTTTGSTDGSDVAKWVQMERLPRAAVPGAALFESQGCGACHTYAGSGRANLGAPDLTSYGRLRLGTDFDIRFLRCPSCVKPGSAMPAFDSLSDRQLRQLAVFLEASKGIR